MLADGAVVGGIFKPAASPVGAPWMWTAFGHCADQAPTHGYEPTREAAMACKRAEDFSVTVRRE
jgi:hypothetical protein